MGRPGAAGGIGDRRLAGLGAATAQLFAERGASVVGIARDAERMSDEPAGVPGGFAPGRHR